MTPKEILINNIREYLRPSFPEEGLEKIVKLYLCLKEEQEALVNAMKEFGKLAFEAGREDKLDDDCNGFDILIPKYNTYEEYLKELYGEE